jgi:hypothetical protein
VPQGWRDLAHDASAWFERAQRRQTEGDWAGYGEALEALADSLSKLERMAGDGEVTSNAASQEEALEALSEEEPAGVGSETPDPPQE